MAGHRVPPPCRPLLSPLRPIKGRARAPISSHLPRFTSPRLTSSPLCAVPPHRAGRVGCRQSLAARFAVAVDPLSKLAPPVPPCRQAANPSLLVVVGSSPEHHRARGPVPATSTPPQLQFRLLHHLPVTSEYISPSSPSPHLSVPLLTKTPSAPSHY
jgi:hypothetical protein